MRGLRNVFRSPILRHLSLFSAAVLLCNSCSKTTGPSDADDVPTKEWTFLLYDDADFYHAYDPLDDFSREVCSGDHLNVLVIVDSEIGPAAIGYIDEDHVQVKLKDLGEVNMGSASTLADFLTYAKEHYPAERYIISFYDHGGGWRGACWDGTSDNDNLTMGEMKEALSSTGGVDLVLFSAPCLMGSFEAAYNLRSCTDVYIGSENTSGYAWWKVPMGDICDALHSNPDISSYQLGEFIIESIWEHRTIYEAAGWAASLTMSAVRSDRLEAIKDAVDSLSHHYLAGIEKFRSHVDSIYNDITLFSSSFADLHDLAGEFLSVEDDPQVRYTLQSVQQNLEDAVIAECHGSDWPDARGLTIFFPDTSSVHYLPLYTSTEYGLDFVQDAHWDELLTSLFSQFGIDKRGIIVPGPPRTNGFIIPGNRAYRR